MAHINIRSLYASYRNLAYDIATFTKDMRNFLAITSSLSGAFAAPVGILIKSHKPQTQIGVRTLHKASASAFDGLSQWLVEVLSLLLSNVQGLHADSRNVREKLKDLTITDRTVVAKLDLKDFLP